MFTGPFKEACHAEVHLPEPPEVVEAMLEYIYTGQLPAGNPCPVLSLAHRLDFQECVVACAKAADSWKPAEVVCALAPLRGSVVIDAAWNRLQTRLRDDPKALGDALASLAEPEFHTNRASIREVMQNCPSEHNYRIDASTQTEFIDASSHDEPEHDSDQCDVTGGCHKRESHNSCGHGVYVGTQSGEDNADSDNSQEKSSGSADNSDATDDEFPIECHSEAVRDISDNIFAGQQYVQEAGTSGQGDTCYISSYNLSNKSFQDALGKLGAEWPQWANGAAVLNPGLTAPIMQQAGVNLAKLREWNVIHNASDSGRLREFLRREIPYPKRPRERPKKRIIVALPEASYMEREAEGVCHSKPCETEGEAMRIQDLEAFEDAIQMGCHTDDLAVDTPAFIDEETAALIQQEQWATGVAARLAQESALDHGNEPPVRNGFVHFSIPPSSPRTTRTS